MNNLKTMNRLNLRHAQIASSRRWSLLAAAVLTTSSLVLTFVYTVGFPRQSPRTALIAAQPQAHVKTKSNWSDYSIVVSRFKEPKMSWLDALTAVFPADNIHIYNKINNKYKPARFRNNLMLRNIGKCDHSFLTHVVNNYARLTEWTLFMTPRYKKHLLQHIEPLIKSPLDLFQFCDKSMWLLSAKAYFSPKCQDLDYFCRDYRLTKYVGSVLRANKSNLTFGEWMEKFVEPKFDDYVRREGAHVNFGGTFCYSKKRILSRPLEYYKSLMTQFDANDSEVAHFFERAWYYIFNAHL